tara:strand:- start:122 stop:574 length:453 start_codon:yes stop_codon:yes gene_type:complete
MKKMNGRRRQRGHNRKNYNNINKNTVLESSGPKSQLRGNAFQLNEKYSSLGSDAAANDDKVLSESYFQFADHYYRLNKEIEATMLNKAAENLNSNEGNKEEVNLDEKKRLSRKDRSLIAKSEEIKNTDFENKLPKKFNKNNEIDIKEVSK